MLVALSNALNDALLVQSLHIDLGIKQIPILLPSHSPFFNTGIISLYLTSLAAGYVVPTRYE